MASGNKPVFDTARFELAGLSFAGAPTYVVLAGTVLLTFSTLHEYGYLRSRLANTGGARLVVGGVFFAALTSFAFASLCFAAGRLLAWLIGP